jgi:hypothetical protein
MEDKTKVRIGPLTSVGRVGIEIGRLYRKARRGEIETIEAYRLTQCLLGLKACLESSEIEQRLADLETALLATHHGSANRPRLVS